jgi:hypothetical protein
LLATSVAPLVTAVANSRALGTPAWTPELAALCRRVFFADDMIFLHKSQVAPYVGKRKRVASPLEYPNAFSGSELIL